MEISIEGLLTAGATIVLAGVTWWKTVKSVPQTNRLLDADAASKFEEIAASAAERNRLLLERIRKVEDRFDEVCDELNGLRRVMNDWEDGINVLLDQLSDEGLDPCWRPKPSNRSS